MIKGTYLSCVNKHPSPIASPINIASTSNPKPTNEEKTTMIENLKRKRNSGLRNISPCWILIITNVANLFVSYLLIYSFSFIEVQFPPKLSFSGANPNKKYIIIGLDLDPPFPSFPFLGPALHWIQTGLTIAAADQATGLLSVVGPSDNDTAGATTTTTTTTATVVPPLASYHPPRPPPGSSPHRYVFLLYEQPEDFDRQVDRKPIGLSDRPRFDYNGFLERTGLGEVVAVNYYLSK